MDSKGKAKQEVKRRRKRRTHETRVRFHFDYYRTASIYLDAFCWPIMSATSRAYVLR